MKISTWGRKTIDSLLEMFRESVIIQAFMAGIITYTIARLTWLGRGDELSKEFWVMAGAIYGYYFKSKNDNQLKLLIQSVQELVAQQGGKVE